MKTIVLFVLLMTPTKECIEKATKANLINCREGVNGPSVNNCIFTSGYLECPNTASMATIVCDMVPEKDRVPIPKEDYKLSIERPTYPLNDSCYTYKVGKLEVPIEETTFSFIGSVTANSVTYGGVSISTHTMQGTWPNKSRKHAK